MEPLCTQLVGHWGAVKHKQAFLSITVDQTGTGAGGRAGQPGIEQMNSAENKQRAATNV